METQTPMLQQYQRIKSQHKDCILFFRLGDFYEMFFDDAKAGSDILDLVLTSRGKGTANHIPMCGVPYHAAESYIAKLIKAGRKVAICEQVEDPAAAQGLVKRDVIRVITSGTFLDELSSDARYLLCLNPGKDRLGMAFIDPTNGTIQTNEYPNHQRAVELISRLPVYECVYPDHAEEAVKNLFRHPLLKIKNIVMSSHEDWCFNPDIAKKTLCEHFSVMNLRGFGIEDLHAAVASAGALLEYLKQMNKQPLRHIDRVALYTDNEFVYISPAATYGLELETLFKTINRASTAAGKRKLRLWLYHPLVQPAAILQRQAAVTLLKDQTNIQRLLGEILGRFPDIEKNISRMSCGYTHAKDVLAIRNTLTLLPDLMDAVSSLAGKNRLFAVEDIPDLRKLLEDAVNPDMPITNPEGKIINKGYNAELDGLRDIQENGQQWLRGFQEREIKRTKINSLKVGFNRVFGYYIEITKSNIGSAPSDYIRKQTLVNGERYITPELKEYEDKILTAQDKIYKIENEILLKLQKEILDHSVMLHAYAQAAATIDVLLSLSILAQQPGYTAPQISEEPVLDIRDGRHPVVENNLTDHFVPNDTYLDCGENHLIILTGPNMAGKSTYIRQIAILTILAQTGSYIPAASAKIGVVDKIFTRIGAHDDITKGQSTFMVEMTEAADIINNLSERSLIILDEIGRGTSTFDGLSLAWALAEHLQKTRARTLFATHFHELTALAEQHTGVKNYNVAVKEWKDEIIFLHKIVPGSTDDSYGIYVAKLAGIPKNIINRSRQILTQLELKGNLKEQITGQPPGESQLSLFAGPDPVAEDIKAELQKLDINTLTPVEALNKLQELKEKLNT
ncbi:MAG: DNA mismatch repair protein MutS [Candidatus Omnitrophota bacterium]|nr:DNA mismatch repair protein MutS [Candidatus Omnitrophota bacterium]